MRGVMVDGEAAPRLYGRDMWSVDLAKSGEQWEKQVWWTDREDALRSGRLTFHCGKSKGELCDQACTGLSKTGGWSCA